MFGLEVALVYIGLGIAGAFGVSKGVEVWRHSMTVESDKYRSCVEATKDPRECRGLE